jgi:hypothetical protein
MGYRTRTTKSLINQIIVEDRIDVLTLKLKSTRSLSVKSLMIDKTKIIYTITERLKKLPVG